MVNDLAGVFHVVLTTQVGFHAFNLLELGGFMTDDVSFFESYVACGRGFCDPVFVVVNLLVEAGVVQVYVSDYAFEFIMPIQQAPAV